MLDSLHSTNNNEEDENHETIEKVLQEFEKNYLKVENMECSPGSQLGDNYMSIVKRVKVSGKLANGSGK